MALIVLMLLFSLVINTSANTIIQVNGKSCHYSIKASVGWDTIPSDTLLKKFGKSVFDIGLFETKGKSNFDGRYIQYVFMPTRNTLNQYAFDQIYKDIKNSCSIDAKRLRVGQNSLIMDIVKADKDNHLIFTTGRVVSGAKERRYSQIMVLCKFGFLKIVRYEAKGAKITNTDYTDLLSSVDISKISQYTEPPSKINLGIRHIIIAFAIGLFVYFGILYSTNIRRLITKN